MQKTITVDVEIRYKGEQCGDRHYYCVYQNNNCCVLHRRANGQPTELKQVLDVGIRDTVYYRCRACLEKTGDV